MGWEQDIEQDFGEGQSLEACLTHVLGVIRRTHDPGVHYDVAVVEWLERTLDKLKQG